MRIAVVGTGYVGLVKGTCLARLGHDVTCVDAMPERVDAVIQGKPTFYEPGLAEMLGEGRDELDAMLDVSLADDLEAQFALVAPENPRHRAAVAASTRS